MSTIDRLSAAVSVTLTAPPYQPLGSGSGTLAVVLGAVRSILTFGLSALFALPALSLIVLLATRSLPSPVSLLSSGHEPCTPDSESSHVHAMKTSSLYQPLSLAAVLGAPLSEGAVLSTLTFSTPAAAVLPAASVAVPLAAWP